MPVVCADAACAGAAPQTGDPGMNEQMRTGMREASRLTRAGRLLEATATIQRTLRGMRAPFVAGEPSDQPADQVIEGEFWVSDPAPHSTQAGTQEPERRPSASIVTLLPPPSVPTPRER